MAISEEMIAKMRKDCAEAIELLDAALAIASTPEMEILREQWTAAQNGVENLLFLNGLDPDRDMSGLTHCVLWFMVVHSSGLDVLKRGVKQVRKRDRKRKP